MLKMKSKNRRKLAAGATASVMETLEKRVFLSAAPDGTVTFVLSINDDGFGDYAPNAFAIYAIDGTVNGTAVTPNSIQANNGGVDGGISNFNVIVGGATAGSLNDDIFNGTTYTAHSGSGTGKLRRSTYYQLTDSATQSQGPTAVEAGFTYGILNGDNSSTDVAAGQDVVGSPPSLANVKSASSSTLIIFGLGQSAGDMQNFATATTGNNPGVPSGTTFSGGAPASYPYAGPGTFTYGGNTYLSSLLVADGHYVTGTPPTIDTADSSAGLLAAYDEAYNSSIGGWTGAGAATVVAAVTQTLTATATSTTTSTAVTSSNLSATYGQSVTFTATVTPTSGVGETGTVQFQIDGTSVGSPVALSNNIATYTASGLTPADYSVTAIYSGDSNFTGSTSPTFTQSVGLAPTTTAVTSSNGSITSGQSVTFTATVTPTGASGETSSVQFQIDGGNTGSPVALSGNTAQYTPASPLAIGSHSVVAVYSGDSDFATSTSPAFSQSVANPSTTSGPQSLAITGQPGNGSAGNAISTAMTVAIEDANGNVVTNQTSTITLSIASGPSGAALEGTTAVATVNGVATFTNIFANAAGTYTLTATDAPLTGTTSAPFTLSQPAGFATLTNGALLVNGTPAADTITLTTSGASLIATLNGVSSSPILLASIASIDVEAGAGNDYVSLGAGVPGSSVQGGAGDDTIMGGPGNDTLGGGAGNDSISGGPGDDSIKGGMGDDVLAGGKGNDTIFGSLGNDTLRGGLGDDSLNGGAGTNQLYGGQGNNIFYAVNGTADEIFAGAATNDSVIYGPNDHYIIETGIIRSGNKTPLA